MKKLGFALFMLAGLAARAQQNTLLTSPFWQNKPDVETVKAEIAKGNSPSQFSSNAFDPVVMAINSNAPTATIKYLVDQPGNDVNKLTHDGRIYLHWAALRGNAEVVAYLLSKGSKISIVDTHDSTPLLFAASAGQADTKIYDLLLAHGDNLKTNVNADGANALLLAIANDKDMALTNYFVSKGLSLNTADAAGNNAFSYAARSGNQEVLKTLIQKGIKPGQTAMLMAAQGRSTAGLPFYQYLESLGIKANATSKTGENILHALVRKPNQQELITYFMGKGVDVNQANEDGNTVFMTAAASSRDTALLTTLLTKVKNVNQANLQGATALALAVRGNTSGTVNYLLGKGAGAKVVDKKDNNLAYYLVDSYRPVQTMQTPDEFDLKMAALKKAGFDVTAAQPNGNTLYHLAVAKNNLALVQRLQPLGIDVNAKNKEGITALHKAAMIARDEKLMQYLLSIGAKKDIGTGFGETAHDLASANETLTKNNVSLTFLK